VARSQSRSSSSSVSQVSPQRSPKSRKAEKAPPAADVDPDLREFLREWRRTTAKRQLVPAYVIMHDSSLDDLCRKLPSSLAALRHVSGFGEKKTELYGPDILEALAEFRQKGRVAIQAIE
jgi:ATP-dependent DNA helicase RecQ